MSVRKKEAGAARLDCIRNKKIGHNVQQGLTVEVVRERREREWIEGDSERDVQRNGTK